MSVNGEPADEGLTTRTVHGVSWSLLSTAISMVATLGVTAVLARLLAPAAFGLVAMAGVVLHFGTYFAQLGVGSALVQRRHLTEAEVRACFTVSVGMGFLFGALFYVLGPKLGQIVFDSTSLAPVIQVLSLSFVLDGLAVTPVALLRRRLDFRWLAATDLCAYLLGYSLVAVTMAVAGAGVWSLVGGALAQSSLAAGLSYVRVRHSLRFTTHWRTYKPLLSYGGRISVISVLEFLGYCIEPVAIGRYLGSSQVGVFTTVQRLSTYPAERAVTSTTRVLFPSLSTVQADPGRFRYGYVAIYFSAGLLTVPLALFTSVAAREVVAVVLGPQWQSAVTPLRVIALAVPFTILSHVNGVSLDALARLTGRLNANVVYICIGVPLILLGLQFGLTGVVATYVALEALYWGATLFLVRTVVSVGWLKMLGAHAGMIIAGALAAIGTFAATLIGNFGELPPVAVLALQIAGALAGMAVFAVLPWEVTRRDLCRLADALSASHLSVAMPRIGRMLHRFTTAANGGNSTGRPPSAEP